MGVAWQLWAPCVLALAAGVLLGRAVAPEWDLWLAYAAAFGFGIAVGSTELIQRYRDQPVAPLRTPPGFLYLAVNGLAAAAALWLIQATDTLTTQTAIPVLPAQVLLAGFGTMAFFRSALFTFRVGDGDVPVGPAAVLQVILDAADRSCDRLRAQVRSSAVERIMQDVSFEAARAVLPGHCLMLMQNLAERERTALSEAIERLGRAAGCSDRAKALQLGLMLINLVGEEVLEDAVTALRAEIMPPAPAPPPAPDLRATDEPLAEEELRPN